MIKLILYLFIVCLVTFTGCSNNNKKIATTSSILIYKTWHFKKTDNASSHKTTAWIGNNILDMRNTDTLQFSYGGMHNKPTAYPYQILHDTIFIQHSPAYKIVKLKDSTLYLRAIFGNSKVMGKDSVVMIYGIK